jgi:hypothetical protein
MDGDGDLGGVVFVIMFRTLEVEEQSQLLCNDVEEMLLLCSEEL